MVPAVAQHQTGILHGGRQRFDITQVSQHGVVDAAVLDGRGGDEDGLDGRLPAAETDFLELSGLPVPALGFPDGDAGVADGDGLHQIGCLRTPVRQAAQEAGLDDLPVGLGAGLLQVRDRSVVDKTGHTEPAAQEGPLISVGEDPDLPGFSYGSAGVRAAGS